MTSVASWSIDRNLSMAAAALLAGCTGASQPLSTAQTYYDNSFAGNEIGYASQFGAIPVFARGGPFENSRNVDALVAILNQNHAASGLKFAVATATGANAYSVVFVYGQSLLGTNNCNRLAPPAPAAPGNQVTGSFCLPGYIRSQGVIALPATADLSAPPVHDAVDELATALFSPDRGRSRGRSFD